ncbi:amino acid adenylation domain-containing protein [Gordonia sp. (in: high G+C Gram-positive bacteria)]|uniref:amino acid adenylation domain-containing protein n=1 Tax=Gordonia sp. (in: high G+C Gram-positive bacteria) TaxID=84139 RepID=UPI0035284F0A
MAAIPSAPSLTRLLRDQIDRFSTEPAVVTDTGTSTFAELAVMIEVLSAKLVPIGATTAAIYLDPGVHAIAAAWSALSSSIAYVPLTPGYPVERLRGMVRDSASDVILTSSIREAEARALARGTTIEVLVIDDVLAGAERRAGALIHRGREPRHEDIAYVLYTSGSTGTPKGVEISHAALAHQIVWTATALGLAAGRRVLLKTPLSFDAAQWELLANATGATIVVGSRDLHRRPADLLDCIRRHRATHLQVVPTLLDELCVDPSFSECTSLTLIASGGETLRGPTAAGVRRQLPAARIMNLYGPTEATINVTAHLVRDDDCGPQDVPIGGPVTGHRLFLLDELGRVSPAERAADGVIGELAVHGPQLALGYRSRPAETSAAFITRIVDGAALRLYRTGDLVQADSQRQLRYRGRTDQQVSLRGHRIELEEIRAVVDGHPAVRSSVVLLTRGARPVLTAHVETAKPLGTVTDEVRRYLADRLPSFMVPAHIHATARLPRLPNGKIDRESLRIRPTTVHEVAGETARRLAALWRTVLGGTPQLTMTTTFTEAGGSSLSALRLVDGVERVFGVHWSLDTVATHDTLAAQCALLEAHERCAEPSRLVPLSGTSGPAVVLWPGLGGFPLGLRPLSRAIAADGFTCHAIRGSGLHRGETPPHGLDEAARLDAALLDSLPSDGPLSLVGYSAGARLATRVAALLVSAGSPPDSLVLIAPGSPIPLPPHALTPDEVYRHPGVVRILCSVFTGTVTGVTVDEVVSKTCDRRSFVQAVSSAVGMDPDFARRICRVSETTLTDAGVPTDVGAVPTTIMTAAGDDDRYAPPARGTVRRVSLEATHYDVLRPSAVSLTAAGVREALSGARG